MISLAALLAIPCMAQAPRMPNLEIQRSAMHKLSFLIGKWSGEARTYRRPGETLELVQTEEALYKLGGLLLVIEGVGRAKSDGQLALQAFGIVSYDDEKAAYTMRAFNDGRWLETEVKLAEGGQGITWGLSFGEIKTSSLLRINEKGEWTELTEITIGSQPPRKLMELTVRPQR
ncbi:MAG: hypothetical protein ACLQPN_18380 [Bryobacteraceae bacterium]